VEVLRGPQSALYGSDAIGGVINITTKTGEGPMRTTADAEGGSFGTFNSAPQFRVRKATCLCRDGAAFPFPRYAGDAAFRTRN